MWKVAREPRRRSGSRPARRQSEYAFAVGRSATSPKIAALCGEVSRRHLSFRNGSLHRHRARQRRLLRRVASHLHDIRCHLLLSRHSPASSRSGIRWPPRSIYSTTTRLRSPIGTIRSSTCWLSHSSREVMFGRSYLVGTRIRRRSSLRRSNRSGAPPGSVPFLVMAPHAGWLQKHMVGPARQPMGGASNRRVGGIPANRARIWGRHPAIAARSGRAYCLPDYQGSVPPIIGSDTPHFEALGPALGWAATCAHGHPLKCH